MRRRNPLLVRPPKHLHGVHDEHHITRHGFPDPKIGVHTATQKNIAAGYAYMAWEGPHYPHTGLQLTSYPVVVALDVHRLRAEPDTDAVLWWFDKGGKESAREALSLLEDAPPHRVVEMMQEHQEPPRIESVTAQFIERIFQGYEVDWDAVIQTDLLEKAVQGNHDAVRRVLLAGFPQRRYLVDFDIDRVVSIEVIKPWLNELIDDYFFETDEVPDGVQKYLDAGFDVVTQDEIDSFEPTYKTIFSSPAFDKQVEYHGTSAEQIAQAFPELVPSFPDIYGDWRSIFK